MNSRQTISNHKSHEPGILLRPIGIILLVGCIFIGMLVMIMLGKSVGNPTFVQQLQSLLGADSVQLWWYVTRASGLTAYSLLWLSMAWGLAIPSRIVQPVLEGTFTYDFHEYLSLMSLGFVFLHILVLMLDKYLPFNLIQILVPFTGTYRPFWVGLGIIGFYIFLLVTLTFYLRTQIGTQMFRSIHVLSLFGYLGTTLHGLFAGTDSALPIAKLLYVATSLTVLFLTVYWLIRRPLASKEEKPGLRTHPGVSQSLLNTRKNRRI
jgi:predicted ferric reductase